MNYEEPTANILAASPNGKLYTDSFWPKWTGGMVTNNLLIFTKDFKLKLVEESNEEDAGYKVIETFDINDIELTSSGDAYSRMFRFKIRGVKYVFQIVGGPSVPEMAAMHGHGIVFFAHIQLAKTNPSAFSSYGSEHFNNLLHDVISELEFSANSRTYFKSSTQTIFYLVPIILAGIIYLHLTGSDDKKWATEVGLIVSLVFTWISGIPLINYVWHRRTGKAFTFLQALLVAIAYIGISIFLFFAVLMVIVSL